MTTASCVPAQPVEDGFGLYLHVPFCHSRCPYCSFYSLAGRQDLVAPYLPSLRRQITDMAALDWTRQRQVDTIFFGGGTPTFLSADQLADLLHHCCRAFPLPDGEPEISIEVNPATIDLRGLITLRRAGFNRLSLGVQSFDDRMLRRIGRIHSAADARQVAGLARRAGFANLSLDLMFGLPGQNTTGWQETLDQTLSVRPDHLSLYELTLEQGTCFARQAAAGELVLPEEDEILAMMACSDRTLAAAGLHRYEISNYARPGRECTHNINYWQNGSYLGLGAGGVSCLSGRRLIGIADVEEFCYRLAAGQPFWSEEEALDREARFRETVIMGLRMIRGVSLSALKARFGINARTYYGDTLQRLLGQNLLVVSHGFLHLTAQGLPVANAVMAELV